MKRKRGRPRSSKPSHYLAERVDDETIGALAQLAEDWQCNRAEALRRAIKQTALLRLRPDLIIEDRGTLTVIEYVRDLSPKTLQDPGRQAHSQRYRAAFEAEVALVERRRVVVDDQIPVSALRELDGRLVLAEVGSKVVLRRAVVEGLGLKLKAVASGQQEYLSEKEIVVILGEARFIQPGSK